MIGSGLKKFSTEYDLTVESGVIHGWLKGCYTTFSEGMGYKRLSIYIGCHHAPDDEQIPADPESIPAYMAAADRVADLILEKAGDPKKYRLMPRGRELPGVVLTQGGSVVQVNFLDNPGTMKCIRNFVEDVLPDVAPMTTPNICSVCGEENDSTFLPVLLTGHAVVPMHLHCAEKIQGATKQVKRQRNPVFPLLPILGALIGALLGAAAWMAVGIAGYMASIVGLLIAFLASKGYDLLGGKPGKMKIVTLVLCVILAVVLGNIGGEIYSLHTYYQEQAAQASGPIVSEAEFLQATIPILWEESEVLGAVIKDMMVGFVFAALGCFGVLRKETYRAENEMQVKLLEGRW